MGEELARSIVKAASILHREEKRRLSFCRLSYDRDEWSIDYGSGKLSTQHQNLLDALNLLSKEGYINNPLSMLDKLNNCESVPRSLFFATNIQIDKIGTNDAHGTNWTSNRLTI